MTEQATSNQSMCPHCGGLFRKERLYHDSLIPRHDFEFRECPGAMQLARNPESDKRPLWKDQVKP